MFAVTDGSAFSDWLMSDNWQDYRQQRAIRELGDEVSSLSSSLYTQQRESSRLRSELSKLQGSVEVRLARLTRAFDAFVELSDLRMTLAMFDPPALVRHRARQVVAAASQGDAPPDADLADVPGYWLAPAATGLVALLRGEDAAAPLALAAERDAERTALLVTLTAAVAGRADVYAEWLPKAFGPLPADGPVSRAVRTLWIEAAAGRFGPEGRALLGARLAALVEGLDAEREDAAAQAWRARVEALPAIVHQLQSIVEPIADAQEALTAGARLAALRELCGRTGGGTDAPTSLPGVLRALVDEGSAEEAPLLRRSAELRAVIEGEEHTPDEPWDAPAGTAPELLLADAFQPDGSPPARAARLAGARWLLAEAERLAGDAATDPPREGTTTVERLPVRVHAGGPPDGLDAVRAKIDARYPEERVPTRTTVALLAGGALLCLSLAAWPNGLAIFFTLAGAVLLVAAAVRWRQERQRRADRRDRHATDLANAQGRADRATTELGDLRERLGAAAQRATGDLAAVKASVAP